MRSSSIDPFQIISTISIKIMELFIKQIIRHQLPRIASFESQQKDWRYQLLNLKDKVLFDRLTLMKRQELLEWLEWNDCNGLYADHNRIRNGLPLFTRQQAFATVYHRIMCEYETWDGYMGKTNVREKMI
jgi:hypothetical protein